MKNDPGNVPFASVWMNHSITRQREKKRDNVKGLGRYWKAAPFHTFSALLRACLGTYIWRLERELKQEGTDHNKGRLLAPLSVSVPNLRGQTTFIGCVCSFGTETKITLIYEMSKTWHGNMSFQRTSPQNRIESCNITNWTNGISSLN